MVAMKSKTCLLYSIVVIGTLASTVCGGGTLVDIQECQKRGLPCGNPNIAPTRQYCCIEQSGPFPFHVCCNPYLSLAIGLSVGIPLLAAIIVCLIVGYCWCSRYHNRKMDRLMIAYRQAQLEENDEQDGGNEELDNPAAPPAYTPVAGSKKPEAGLPVYTKADPFASDKEPAVLPVETEQDNVALITHDEDNH